MPSRMEGTPTVMMPNDAKAIMFQEKKMTSKPEKDLIQNVRLYYVCMHLYFDTFKGHECFRILPRKLRDSDSAHIDSVGGFRAQK